MYLRCLSSLSTFILNSNIFLADLVVSVRLFQVLLMRLGKKFDLILVLANGLNSFRSGFLVLEFWSNNFNFFLSNRRTTMFNAYGDTPPPCRAR